VNRICTYRFSVTVFHGNADVAEHAPARICEWGVREYVVKPNREHPTMIKKVAGGYKVLSEKGKNLGGPYKTRKQAETRLKQVEYFKHHKG
jgi:hypothetical protein